MIFDSRRRAKKREIEERKEEEEEEEPKPRPPQNFATFSYRVYPVKSRIERSPSYNFS